MLLSELAMDKIAETCFRNLNRKCPTRDLLRKFQYIRENTPPALVSRQTLALLLFFMKYTCDDADQSLYNCDKNFISFFNDLIKKAKREHNIKTCRYMVHDYEGGPTCYCMIKSCIVFHRESDFVNILCLPNISSYLDVKRGTFCSLCGGVISVVVIYRDGSKECAAWRSHSCTAEAFLYI